VRRRDRLTLRSPERVEPVIEEWRTEFKRFGMGPATVYDPDALDDRRLTPGRS